MQAAYLLPTVSKTGDPGAQMHWAAVPFKRDVVLFYGILLVGWPPWAPFENPSTLAIATVRHLLKLFELGRLYFRRATPGEIFAARESLFNALPSLLFVRPGAKNCRANLGQHWVRPTIDPVRFPPRFVRNGPKSARGVDTDTESESASEIESGSGSGSGSKDGGTQSESEIEDADGYWGCVARPKARKQYTELEEDPIEEF